MKKAILLALVALLAFAGILLARAPASWMAGFLPESIQCAQISGSLWNGSCSGLVTEGTPMGQLTWNLHALKLFGGKVAAHVDLTNASGFVRGEFESNFSGSDITVRDLAARVPIDQTLAPQVPPNLSGKGNAQLALLRVENGIVTAVQGRVEAHDLETRGAQPYRLGNYAVTFPGGEGEPTGALESLGGPLDVKGTLRLTREPGYSVEGTVAAGPDTDPQLARQLEYLGSPDGQGRRPFSVAGTF
jgi:general secretion pathway protein N